MSAVAGSSSRRSRLSTCLLRTMRVRRTTVNEMAAVRGGIRLAERPCSVWRALRAHSTATTRRG